MAGQNFDLWVSAGSYAAPYYRFYADPSGSQELSDLSFDTNRSYTFRRLNEATSHPFYLSDTAYKESSSDALLITGDGSPSQGITGNESFKVEFVGDPAGNIEELLYYCSSHQSMQGNISLTEPTPESESKPTPEPTPEPEPDDTYELPETTSTVEGTNGKDKLRGKKSRDLILGFDGNDKLNGKKGDDILEGGKGDDKLKGSKGDDYLYGAKGDDVLIGGKGADVFKISRGFDMVNDFKLKKGDRVGLLQEMEYEVIDDVFGTLIRTTNSFQMLLVGQDYDDFLAAGSDVIARIGF